MLLVEGLGPEVTREDLTAAFGEFGEIKFVEYSRGEPAAHVRFGAAGCATKAAAAAADGAREVKGAPCTARALAGEEADEYWARARAALESAVRNRKGGKRGKGKNYRGGKR